MEVESLFLAMCSGRAQTDLGAQPAEPANAEPWSGDATRAEAWACLHGATRS